MSTPEIKQDHMYQLLREGKIKAFNESKALGEATELQGTDLRGLDLRGMDADGIDFSGCYFRQADLRGIDFSRCKLDGASINGAKISGCLFPTEFSAAELELSLLHGTRMREGC
ncbi:MAG: pentapeptide repeat-containing protein [Gammaproteobacteria bacterium]